MRFGKTWLTAAAILGAAGAVRADEVKIRGFPSYATATIADVKDGTLVFRPTSGGQTQTQPLAQVESVQIPGKEAFNRAEKLSADPNLSGAAVQAYEQAASSMSVGWQAKLLAARRLAAAQRAGMLDVAVRDWLAAMDESAAAAVIDLRPKLPEKYTGGAAAMAALKSKLNTVKDAAYVAAVKGLLLSLYEKEGLKEEAALLAAELSGGGPATAAGVSARDQLRALQVRLEKGEAQAVLDDVEKDLRQYGAEDLPPALLLAGKARLRLAESSSAADRKKQLVAAGLGLMRVYAYYPKSAEAPEALFLAGQVHTLLPPPNAAAAAAAFGKVLQEYPSSPFAARAKEALDKVRK